jgi:transposase InsO family protein
MEEDFVLDTILELIEKHKVSLSNKTIIHSDQGIHYKAYTFQELIRDSGLRQSMSAKGVCADNAPQESFHGHMKDEVDIKSAKTFEELVKLIEDYIDYYNNDRPQYNLAKLTPSEYYWYSITGKHKTIKKTTLINKYCCRL